MTKRSVRSILRRGCTADLVEINLLRSHADEGLGSLGPRSIFDRLQEGSCIVKARGPQIFGYVIWYKHRRSIPANLPIHQLCVDALHRRKHIATQLINQLKQESFNEGYQALSAWCRCTLPANIFFRNLGFIPWATHPGGGKRKTPMIWWRLTHDAVQWDEGTAPQIPTRAGYLSAARKRIRNTTVAERYALLSCPANEWSDTARKLLTAPANLD